MQILKLDGSNSRFISITVENLRRYALVDFVWDYELTEDKIVELIVTEKLKLDNKHDKVFWYIWLYVSEPLGDFKQWKNHLYDKVKKDPVNQLEKVLTFEGDDADNWQDIIEEPYG